MHECMFGEKNVVSCMHVGVFGEENMVSCMHERRFFSRRVCACGVFGALRAMDGAMWGTRNAVCKIGPHVVVNFEAHNRCCGVWRSRGRL